MSNKSIVNEQGEILIPDPQIAYTLFQTVKVAWLWLILRLYLSATWIPAGWGKINNPVWMDGTALKGFWTNAASVPETGQPQITYEWYRAFIQFMLDNGWYSWFGPLIAYTELLLGIALLLGAFVGVAAFTGAFMNLNFMLAGAASTNPVMFTCAILLILAWKVAGWYGLDRWLLPRLGTPWTRNRSEPEVTAVPT